MKVFKYDIKLQHEQELIVPKGAKLLSVQQQRGSIVAWFVVDPAVRYREVISVRVCGTGHDAPDLNHYCHVSTVQIDEFVWHVFFDKKFLLDTN